MDESTHESSIRALEATGRFRVLRRADLPRVFDKTVDAKSKLATIVDVETTGLDLHRDEIIEIAMISFSYDDDGRPKDVIEIYSSLRQASRRIPPEITSLTGISNEDVVGKSPDMQAIDRIVEQSSILLAHNAGFDRPFCERLSSSFADKPWACSATEIDWRRHGFEGTRLAYILNQFGYFHDGHRALDDCVALFKILSLHFADTGTSVFSDLLTRARTTRYRISVAAPFEMRDTLRARGYRWHPGSLRRPRSWWIEVDEDSRQSEINSLISAGINIKGIRSQTLTAFDRFKADTASISEVPTE